MSKKSIFTTITPLPAGMTRQVAVAFLQDHLAMIDLNPLVIDRQRIPPPSHALADELPCTWYMVTDRISYLPGVKLASGSVSYSCAFLDLAGVGLQTHCYAPMGVDLRTKWSVGGSAPGEAREVAELGVGAPAEGLYLREDTELRCSLVMSSFVKKTLKDSHKRLVEKLTLRGALEAREKEHRERLLGVSSNGDANGKGTAEDLEKRRVSAASPASSREGNYHRFSTASYYTQREAALGCGSASSGGGATTPASAGTCSSGGLDSHGAAAEHPRNANHHADHHHADHHHHHHHPSQNGSNVYNAQEHGSHASSVPSPNGMHQNGCGGQYQTQQLSPAPAYELHASSVNQRAVELE